MCLGASLTEPEVSMFIYRLGYTDKAVVSARAARKKRWICFFISLILLAIVAIIVAVVVTQNINKKK